MGFYINALCAPAFLGTWNRLQATRIPGEISWVWLDDQIIYKSVGQMANDFPQDRWMRAKQPFLFPAYGFNIVFVRFAQTLKVGTSGWWSAKKTQLIFTASKTTSSAMFVQCQLSNQPFCAA
jgi:hypothetical protein